MILLPALASDELPFIPAAPESLMPPGMAERLPVMAPAAPWQCVFGGHLWIQRAGAGAAAVLPEPLRQRSRPRWVVGGFVRYTDSPVGPYAEVYAGLVVRSGSRLRAHVPFMAVDSLESLRAGRANWALPKSLATFEGVPTTAGTTSGVMEADGAAWQVRVTARAFGPRLPLRAGVTVEQVRPDGSVGIFKAVVSGRARLARMDVEVVSQASLGSWMPSGRHLATEWTDASLRVSRATAWNRHA